MIFHLFFCTALTFMCGGFTRDIASQMNDKTLHWIGKGIEYTPGGLKAVDDSWEFLCKPPLLPWGNICYEAYRQGPCQRGSFIRPSIGELVPRCVENLCRKDGWAPYNGTCHALGSRGPCAPNRVFGVDRTTFNLECVPRSRRTMNVVKKYKLRPKYQQIVEAPMIGSKRQKCPPGTHRSRTGACRIPLSETFD